MTAVGHESPTGPGATERPSDRVGSIAPFRVVEVMERAWDLERQTGRPVLHLVAGEPDFGTPQPVVEAATQAIAGGSVPYTPARGLPALREAIRGYYSERFGVDVPDDRIVVTTGGSAALFLAFAVTLEPGDGVLMADPGYPCNANLVRVLSGAVQAVPVTAADNFQLNTARVRSAWAHETRAVLTATPSNPTGTVVEPDELEAIVALTHARGATAIVDEVYGELVYDRTPTTVLSATDDAFVISSFSKTFGMTGWRLGWMVCPDWALDAVTRVTQNMYISPPTPSQAAGIAAFSPAVWDIVAGRLALLRARRDLLVHGLRDIGFDVPVTPQGAFYVYARCDAFCSDSTELVDRLLREAGVAVAPGNDFGTFEAHRHIRLSYATSLAHIEEALERLAAHLVP